MPRFNIVEFDHARHRPALRALQHDPALQQARQQAGARHAPFIEGGNAQSAQHHHARDDDRREDAQAHDQGFVQLVTRHEEIGDQHAGEQHDRRQARHHHDQEALGLALLEEALLQFTGKRHPRETLGDGPVDQIGLVGLLPMLHG
jgi:hypothetical protein